MSALARLGWIGLVATMVAGCGSEGGGGSASAATVSGTAQAAPAGAKGKLVIDPEVQKRLEAVEKGCELSESDASVSSCKNKEDDALRDYAKEKKSPNVLETVLEYALTKGKTDKKALSASLGAIKGFLPVRDQEWMKMNATPAAAERAIALVAAVPNDAASSLGLTIAGAAILGGMRSELTAALDKLKPGDVIRNEAYLYYMDFGGLSVIPDLDKLTKSTDSKERFAALQTVGIAIYEDPTGIHKPMGDPDRAKACDWAKGYLSNPDKDVLRGAIDSISRCKGAYMDAALAELEKRAGNDADAAWVVQDAYHMCWAEGLVGGAMNGTPDQCKKAFAVGEKAAENKSLSGEALRSAVWALGYIGRNSGEKDKAKAALQKFVGSKEKSVADEAKRGIEMLSK